MERKIKLELTQIYGSAQYPREISVIREKLKRIKIKTTNKADLDISTSDTRTETNSEQQIEKVNSFLKKGDKILLRLGGSYGKLIGLLKDSGQVLATAGEEGFTKSGTNQIVRTIQVIPEFAEITPTSEIETVSGLVSVNGSFGGRTTQKPTIWDTLPTGTTEIVLIYPDAFDGKVMKMLKMAENLNFCERRRGKIKIIS